MINNFLLRILSSLIIAPLCFYIVYKGSFFFISFLLICLIFIITESKNLITQKKHFVLFIVFIFFSLFCAYKIRNFYIDNETKNIIIFFGVLLISISTDIGGYVFGKIFSIEWPLPVWVYDIINHQYNPDVFYVSVDIKC